MAAMTTLERDAAALGPALPGRPLDDGVIAIDGCGSLFLFDLARARFQRLPRGCDPWRAARYGSWAPLDELVVEADGTIIVQPGPGGGPRVRSHAHGAGCACAPDGAPARF
jgi:hypothetical protein